MNCDTINQASWVPWVAHFQTKPTVFRVILTSLDMFKKTFPMFPKGTTAGASFPGFFPDLHIFHRSLRNSMMPYIVHVATVPTTRLPNDHSTI